MRVAIWCLQIPSKFPVNWYSSNLVLRLGGFFEHSYCQHLAHNVISIQLSLLGKYSVLLCLWKWYIMFSSPSFTASSSVIRSHATRPGFWHSRTDSNYWIKIFHYFSIAYFSLLQLLRPFVWPRKFSRQEINPHEDPLASVQNSQYLCSSWCYRILSHKSFC